MVHIVFDEKCSNYHPQMTKPLAEHGIFGPVARNWREGNFNEDRVTYSRRTFLTNCFKENSKQV